MEIKPVAVRLLTRAVAVFLKDLEALPEEAFSQSFSPVARTVADIVYEVNLVNDHVCMTIRGEAPPAWPDEGWIKAPQEFQTKQTAIESFDKSSKAAIATAEALTEEELEGTIVTEHGDSTRFGQCQFMALHMWYHSGQLNYIQTLRGDDAWHW